MILGLAGFIVLTMKIDRGKFIDWLNSKWKGDRACPVCGETQSWSADSPIWELREYEGGKLRMDSSIFPCLPVVCEKCGYSFFINAMVAGLLEAKKQEKG